MNADLPVLPSLAATREKTVIPNGVLGMLLFVACEVMFFAALFSAYMVVSAGVAEWPPADQPRLPVATTAANTFILLLSGLFMFLSNQRFRKSGNLGDARTFLGYSIGCAVFFVAFQGFEWARLLSYGLTMQSSSYGSFFYLIVGTHAFHAVIAIGLLIYQFFKLRKNQLSAVEYWTMQVFWYFVVAVWPFLFFLVYLN